MSLFGQRVPPACAVAALRRCAIRLLPARRCSAIAGGSSSLIASGRGDRMERPIKPSALHKVLLHSCCAPCSGAMIEEMVSSGHEVTVFFYNPNIHPRQEYEIRKDENKRYAEELGIPFVDADYDADEWYARTRGMEYDPERGRRCSACFDMRMERTAEYAREHGFDCFTTTNATSRWKDQKQVNASGLSAAAKQGFRPFYWVYDWQTERMTERKYRINAEQRFYKQEYCGCTYSLRDSNLWRKQQGIAPVKIGGEEAGLGTRYYEDAEADAEEESQEVVDSFFASAEQHFDNVKVYKGRKRADVATKGDGIEHNTSSGNNW
mmetsp:Transcript_14837/g.33933  ORF Transcript_14837/g.33933 Transcript_14837/m.33933 type:complete len:322 (-) Transcript_14837:137-1102(-)